MRWPGIEPGSTAWKATMLTITPPSPRDAVMLANAVNMNKCILRATSFLGVHEVSLLQKWSSPYHLHFKPNMNCFPSNIIGIHYVLISNSSFIFISKENELLWYSRLRPTVQINEHTLTHIYSILTDPKQPTSLSPDSKTDGIKIIV